MLSVVIEMILIFINIDFQFTCYYVENVGLNYSSSIRCYYQVIYKSIYNNTNCVISILMKVPDFISNKAFLFERCSYCVCDMLLRNLLMRRSNPAITSALSFSFQSQFFVRDFGVLEIFELLIVPSLAISCIRPPALPISYGQ